jgi:hypothetical protein
MNEAELLKSIDQLHALLTQSQQVGIIIGRNQNIDKMAAALSLYLAMTEAGRNVQVISSQEPIVELANLVGVDRVGKQFSGITRALTVSVPYNEGEVEKVSYSTEGDRMNFNIIASESGLRPFSREDIQIFAQGATPDVVIAVGVETEAEIRAYVEAGSPTKIVNIDNNSANEQYGDVQIAKDSYSSISEIIAVLLQELALPINIDIAQNLMDGVMSATRNFTIPQTSSYAFEAAAVLMRQGAQRISASQKQQRQQQGIPPFRPEQLTIRNQGSTFQPQSNGQARNQNQAHNQSPMMEQPVQNPASQPVEELEQIPQPQYSAAGIENKESKSVSNEDFGEPQDIPSDWFVPKVFKGSKKPGQQ